MQVRNSTVQQLNISELWRKGPPMQAQRYSFTIVVGVLNNIVEVNFVLTADSAVYTVHTYMCICSVALNESRTMHALLELQYLCSICRSCYLII